MNCVLQFEEQFSTLVLNAKLRAGAFGTGALMMEEYEMTKKRKALWIVGAAVLALVLAAAAYYAVNMAKRVYHDILDAVASARDRVIIELEKSSVKEHPAYTFDYSWMEAEDYVAHAFGGIDGNDYTNSVEAFEENYALGHRIFEVDFDYTSDDYSMLINHDEKMWRDSSGVEDAPYSREVFLNSKLYDRYTTMDLEDLIRLMAEYPDIYIVTDTKYMDRKSIILEFSQIVREAEKTDPSVLDRIIPQFYYEDMLWIVMDIYPFRSVIFTLYQTDWTADSVYDFCFRSGCRYITMWADLAEPETIALWKTMGIHTAVHTVNDPEEAKRYFDMGVDMIYTDYLTP